MQDESREGKFVESMKGRRMEMSGPMDGSSFSFFGLVCFSGMVFFLFGPKMGMSGSRSGAGLGV